MAAKKPAPRHPPLPKPIKWTPPPPKPKRVVPPMWKGKPIQTPERPPFKEKEWPLRERVKPRIGIPPQTRSKKLEPRIGIPPQVNPIKFKSAPRRSPTLKWNIKKR